MTIVVATQLALPGLTHSAHRVERRLREVVRLGGGVLIAPISETGPVMIPGIRHLDPGIPIGARPEHVAAIISDVVQNYVSDARPRLVHCLGVRAAIGAMTGARGIPVILEPGQLPSQRIRDGRRELPAAKVLDLVNLEDKAIQRSDGLVVRSQLEAATLIGRGAQGDRVTIVPDGLPIDGEAGPISQLPSLATVVNGSPEADLSTLTAALIRINRPFKMTIFHGGETVRAEARRALSQGAIGARVEFVPIAHDIALRLAGTQVMVCAPQPGRSLAAGGWLPETVPWALALGCPLVAPDVGAVRAYAGGGPNYYEAGHSGQLFDQLDALLADADLRRDAVGRILERRSALNWSQGSGLVEELWTAQIGVSENS